MLNLNSRLCEGVLTLDLTPQKLSNSSQFTALPTLFYDIFVIFILQPVHLLSEMRSWKLCKSEEFKIFVVVLGTQISISFYNADDTNDAICACKWFV